MLERREKKRKKRTKPVSGVEIGRETILCNAEAGVYYFLRDSSPSPRDTLEKFLSFDPVPIRHASHDCTEIEIHVSTIATCILVSPKTSLSLSLSLSLSRRLGTPGMLEIRNTVQIWNLVFLKALHWDDEVFFLFFFFLFRFERCAHDRIFFFLSSFFFPGEGTKTESRSRLLGRSTVRRSINIVGGATVLVTLNILSSV